MIKNIKNILKTSVFIFCGSFLLLNCESEADNIGSQFFQGNAANAEINTYDVIAYNVNNNDSIRVDGRLTNATLGAFSESQFGLQKSHYVAQPRLSAYNPVFGSNVVVDSVVLEVKPIVVADSLTTTTHNTNEFFPAGSNVEAQRVVTTNPIAKYGKKNPITLNVHEVTDFIATTDMIFSNKKVNTGALLGSKTLKGTVSGVKITRKSDNSELLSRDAKIRIPLNSEFFINKIIAKQGQPELSDASNFVRYFRGIRISVPENDGYIFRFTPADTQIHIYYKRDVTSNGATASTPTSLVISLGTAGTYFNQIEFDRTGTPSQAVAQISTPNYNTGDAKLFAQGMGGSSVGVRIPATAIAKLRELYKTKKIGIVSAKLKLNVDHSSAINFPKPATFAPKYFDPTNNRRDNSAFLSDVNAFALLGVRDLVSGHNLNASPAFYEVIVTQSIKDIVEKSVAPRDIILDVGGFLAAPNNAGLVGPNVTSRAYTPNRIVLVGTDANHQNRAQLNVIYSSN